MDVVACYCTLFARRRDDKSEVMLVEWISLLQSARITIDTKEAVLGVEVSTICMSDSCLIDEVLTQLRDGCEDFLIQILYTRKILSSIVLSDSVEEGEGGGMKGRHGGK